MMISNQLPHIKKHPSLVIDASVAINLLGTGMPADLLRCFKQRIVIEENAYHEVESDPYRRTCGRTSLDQLITEQLLHLERLSDDGFALFLQLTGADSPDDLGDGEAATIAHAAMINGIALVDEKKGSRILRERKQPFQSTADLLHSAPCMDGLTHTTLAEAVYAALFHARMRVPPEHREWVIKLIGNERAASCVSLGKANSIMK